MQDTPMYQIKYLQHIIISLIQSELRSTLDQVLIYLL
jgi:hypothetical protein